MIINFDESKTYQIVSFVALQPKKDGIFQIGWITENVFKVYIRLLVFVMVVLW